mmetsp:Transcript_147995/g.210152  ORF Transcript_147995/g.210152 Transcript_147995/m.210152 type:complete len:226 (-) Transcript_147995:774-1451(-)
MCEETHDLVDQGLHFVLVSALQSLFELQVAEESEILGASRVLVQHSLQTSVSALLEASVAVEAGRDHVVHLFFQLEHLFHVRGGVVDHLRVFHNPPGPPFDVRLHGGDDVRQHRRLALEDPVHQFQLVVAAIGEHGLCSGAHLHQVLGSVENQLPLHHSLQLLLGGRVEISAEPTLLVLQSPLNLAQELRARVRSSPAGHFGAIVLCAGRQKLALEVGLVDSARL